MQLKQTRNKARRASLFPSFPSRYFPCFPPDCLVLQYTPRAFLNFFLSGHLLISFITDIIVAEFIFPIQGKERRIAARGAIVGARRRYARYWRTKRILALWCGDGKAAVVYHRYGWKTRCTYYWLQNLPASSSALKRKSVYQHTSQENCQQLPVEWTCEVWLLW